MLDLDAEVLGSYLGEVTEWVGRHAPKTPRTILDLGAGTGTGSLALAHRFPTAEVIALDSSSVMLERIRTRAHAQDLASRVRPLQADLDGTWPQELRAVDIAWAASSLHHVADPDRVLRDIHAALTPGGLLAVVEMDDLPSFLPDDIGLGRPGLESRCHEALTHAGWNKHPDWRSHLKQAGFEIAGQHTFTMHANPASDLGQYAHAFLRRVRFALTDQLAADDLAALDALLADDTPASLLHRNDLSVRGSRTAWAARRPSAIS